MAANAYEPCPCGSGKKMKWCCFDYFPHIEKAFELQQREQHDNAIKEMDLLVSKYPDKPQVYGFYANLLLGEDQPDKADEMLEKAFAIDPNFAMGFLLRGLMRQNENELLGALLLFRKAADAFSLEAAPQLSQVHEMIARIEVMLNRPLASKAAMERAIYFSPGDTELREQYENIFGEETRLPNAACKSYKFRKTAKPIPEDAITGRLSDAKKAFTQVATMVPDDPAAWFNLGLVRAWLGEQPQALEAFKASLELEWNDAHAEETGALMEVLNCAIGMDADTDYIEHRVFMQVRDPEAIFGLLQQMAQAGQILAPQMDPNGTMFSCLVVEEIPNLLDTGTTMAKALANLTIAGGVIRLWFTNADNVNKVAAMLRDRLALAVGEPITSLGISQFGDILQEAIAYPVRTADVGAAEAKLRDRAENYFETLWIHRPLKSLGGVAPIDAAGSKLLRKRLLGVIRFLEDCLDGVSPRKQVDGKPVPIAVYNFNTLRHKLGAELQAAGVAPTLNVPETPLVLGEPKPAAPVKPNFTALNVSELAGVNLEPLSIAELEEGMRASLKLDAKEIAVKYARAGVAKPFDNAKPDRYPLYAVAITGAIAEGNLDLAIKTVSDGMTDDGYHNQGKRMGEYAVQKARLLARSGKLDLAATEFENLLAKHPDEPKFYITAIETMLSAKQPAQALKFAERGLEKAKTLNNRDLDGACRELREAAERMMPKEAPAE
jgi:tetratricopeptide (TPR) repeat protein